MFIVRPRTEAGTARPVVAVPVAAVRRTVEGTTMRVVHHLSFPDEATARGAAELAEMLGWSIEALCTHPSPFPGWLLRVSQDTTESDETVDASRRIFEGLARKGQGTYAGWDVRPAPRHDVRVAS
ncbi:MAG: hypothetical protein JWO46_871 [Nocardioidaceae bacterium]|nr:hypothetical protein [Nocardioidaceae bacterium]